MATAGTSLKPRNACSSALRRQRLERLAGLDENRLVAGRGLKAPHDHIDVEQIELGFGYELDAALPGVPAGWGEAGRGRWRLRERRGRDLAANASGPDDKSNGEGPQ